MQLKEIMSRESDRIHPNATLAEAIQKLGASRGEPLMVYEGDRLVGMLTEHHIVEWATRGGPDARQTLVRQVMDLDAPICFEDQDVQEAARMLREKHAHGVVVMRRNKSVGQPVGTISASDLAESISRLHESAAPFEARVFLQPIAAPSVLGFFAFFGSTFIAGAYMAGWFGTIASPLYIFPFAAVFGGLAQFLAGMWAYRARDTLATAIHGTWGAFWLSFGLMQWLIATGTLVVPFGFFPELGYWFIVLGAITAACAVAALAENIVLFAHLGVLTAGSALAAASFLTGNQGAGRAAGWLLLIAAALAWYLASAMVIECTSNRVILPLGKYHARANRPGQRFTIPVQDERGEPGVKKGQ